MFQENPKNHEEALILRNLNFVTKQNLLFFLPKNKFLKKKKFFRFHNSPRNFNFVDKKNLFIFFQKP